MYKSYTHVEKIDSDSCEGILDNDVVYVTAKIDGTNACIWIENGRLCVGSRTRKITTEKDNAGFASWVFNSGDEEVKNIERLLHQFPNLIVYGEWLGKTKFIGSIKDYDRKSLGHLYIFDVFDTDEGAYLSDAFWRPLLTNYNLDEYFVELLATLSHPTIEDIQKIADGNRFLLDSGSERKAGEGVVVKAPEFVNRYGRQTFGKYVLQDYKDGKKSKKQKHVVDENGVEAEIVEEYVTEAEMTKARAKVMLRLDVDAFDCNNNKHTGMFLSFLYHDAVLEETCNWVKKFKNPRVDFSILKQLTFKKGRQFLGL